MQLISEHSLSMNISIYFEYQLIVTKVLRDWQKLSLVHGILQLLNEIKSQHECFLFKSILFLELKISNHRILILCFVLYREWYLFTRQYLINLATWYILLLGCSYKLTTQFVTWRLQIKTFHLIQLVKLVIVSITVLVSNQRLSEWHESLWILRIAYVSNVKHPLSAGIQAAERSFVLGLRNRGVWGLLQICRIFATRRLHALRFTILLLFRCLLRDIFVGDTLKCNSVCLQALLIMMRQLDNWSCIIYIDVLDVLHYATLSRTTFLTLATLLNSLHNIRRSKRRKAAIILGATSRRLWSVGFFLTRWWAWLELIIHIWV